MRPMQLSPCLMAGPYNANRCEGIPTSYRPLAIHTVRWTMNKTAGEKASSVLVDEFEAKPVSDQSNDDDDVFGDENGHQIQYKTLEWKVTSLLFRIPSHRGHFG